MNTKKIESIHFNSALVPPTDKTMLFIGQDLESIENYTKIENIPTPAGTISYLLFYAINLNNEFNYGGIGLNNNLKPTIDNSNWGAGENNSYLNIKNWPYSCLSIGLSLIEIPQKKYTLENIINGYFDDCIDKLSRFCEMADRPVYIRIGYEFDAAWNNYNARNLYIEAFRYITERMKDKNINPNSTDKIATVWQASTSPFNDYVRGYHPDIMEWYPGDDVVDWFGISYFTPLLKPINTSVCKYTNTQLCDKMLELARNKSKPVMICESTPQGYNIKNLTQKTIGSIDDMPNKLIETFDDPMSIWNSWYSSYFNYIYDNSDVIKIVTYINAKWNSQRMWSFPYTDGYWGDSRIQANPVIEQQWKKELSKPIWLHGSEKLFNTLK